MNQTKTQSLVETLTKAFIGWTVATTTAACLWYPLLEIEASVADVGVLSVIFMAQGIAIGYLVRRLFNRRDNEEIQQQRD